MDQKVKDLSKKRKIIFLSLSISAVPLFLYIVFILFLDSSVINNPAVIILGITLLAAHVGFGFYYNNIIKKKNFYLQYLNDAKNEMENELQENEQKLSILYETMAQGVIFQDSNGKIVESNPMARKILGISEVEMKNRDSNDKRWLSIYEDGTEYPGDQHPTMVALKTGKPVLNKIMGIYNPETEKNIWIIINATPLFKNGEKIPYQVYATFTDITDLKNAQNEQEESRKRYRLLFENMIDGLTINRIILDASGNPIDFSFIDVNPAFEKLTGLKAENIIGKNISDFLSKTDANLLNLLGSVALTGNSARFEKYYELIDRFVEIKAFSQTKMEFVMIVSDISMQKKSEMALKESELHFRNLADSGQALIWTADTNKKCNYFNKTWLNFTGRTLEQELGDGWAEGVYKDDLDYCVNIYQNAFDKREKFSMVYRLKRYDGEYRWIQDNGSPRFNANDEFIGYIGHCLDISELKYFEEKLSLMNDELKIINKIISTISSVKNSTEMFNAILDDLLNLTGLEGGGVCIIEEDETLKLVCGKEMSQAIVDDLQYNNIKVGECLCGHCIKENCPFILHSAEEIENYASREVLKCENFTFHAAFPVKTKNRNVGIICLFSKEGRIPSSQSLKITETISSQVALAIENIQLFEEVKKNVVELEQRVDKRTKQLENANQELEAFGYSVSHDLRAPLRAISGFAAILKESLYDSLDSDNKELLDDILNNANNMKKLIDDLLKFSRISKKEMIKEKFDATELIISVYNELFESSCKGKVDLKIESLPLAFGDKAIIKQVFANLLSNSIKYSWHNEKVKILVSGYEDENETVFAVKDNGIGLDMKFAEKIFGVFQRLHSAGEYEGTGVGLALAKRIVAKHSGKIWVESKEKEGSVFYFSLPKIKDETPL